MLLELRKLMTSPGETLPFETSVDLSDMPFGGCKPVTEPVLAKGQVRNTAGVLEMTGTVETVLHGVCDRCATAFTRPVQYPLRAVLTPEPESDDFEDPWVFELQNDCADLDDIVTTTFVLNMDSKLLCSEDCKGLCSRCGANLNLGPCSCKPEPDPRFAALQQLLEKK